MTKSLMICFVIFLLLTGCVGKADRHVCDGANLIEQGPSEIEMRFCKRYWGGVIGPHGYIGYITMGYGAALIGKGPIFTNPRFQDDPPTFHCVGTITLDREHNQIEVNMFRIVSEPGKPEQTKPHPANGKYLIQSVREANPDERQWFRAWQTNNIW